MAGRSPITVLGLSHSHDSGVALLRDGEVVAAANEERFTRRKQDGSFPSRSLEWLLATTGTAPRQIDIVALAGQHLLSAHSLNNDLSDEDGTHRPAVAIAETLHRVPLVGAALASSAGQMFYRAAQTAGGRVKLRHYRHQLRAFDIAAPLRVYDHHDCHLAGAYYTSETAHDDCLLISNDGFGDGLCAKIAVGRRGRIREVSRTSFHHSLGILYGYATEICGFPRIWHAGKTTGLAAHGDWRGTYAVFAKALRWNENNGRYESHIGLFRDGHNWLRRHLAGVAREDIAAGIQRLTERILVRQIRYWRQRTGLNRVAVVGGVHANVRANQAMAEHDATLTSFYVFPGMGDGGLPLGAACLAASKLGADAGMPRPLRHLYLGPEWSDRQIDELIVGKVAAGERPAGLARRVAELLAEGLVIARFDGRMEYGPRALGNRSILCRATDPNVNAWLNARLGRTEFMPFAPVIRDIDAPRMLDGYTPATRYTSQFMTITFRASDECRAEAPACVHVDGTVRPQVIERSVNPGYYEILDEYHALTGRHVLLNTSFNMHEEPIVCSPEDALRAFAASDLDALVIGRCLVARADRPAAGLSRAVQQGTVHWGAV